MNLQETSLEIREIISNRQKELELTFEEETHKYTMLDLNGILRSNFPSVSKVVKKFHPYFDAPAKALTMCKGNVEEQQKLLSEWKSSGDYSTNMGSRVHYFLESHLIKENGDYKEVRQPIFNVDESQITKSDKMIIAGKDFLDLMKERGGVLLDTEMILGDPELGYTGQPDKGWLMMNKEKNDFGLVITDYKTNQPKNFKPQPYNGYLHSPFNKYRDFALTHYFVQLPLYGRLILKMLKGSKYENIKLLGCVVVLLKDDGTFEEFRVPSDINNGILNLDIKNYVK